MTHKERNTGEVSIRRLKLLKFCARGLSQMLTLRRRLSRRSREAKADVVTRLPTVAPKGADCHCGRRADRARRGLAPPRTSDTPIGRCTNPLRTPAVWRPLWSTHMDSPGTSAATCCSLTTSTSTQVMNTALGDAWVEHVREAWVWMRDRWIPYPFQNNIWRLPKEELVACLNGLLDLQQSPPRRGAGVVSRLAVGGVRHRTVRHVHVSLQPQGVGLRPVATRRRLDGGAGGHRRSQTRARQPCHAPRRCELGTEFDVPVSVARRHRRHLARGRGTVAGRAAAFRSGRRQRRCGQ